MTCKLTCSNSKYWVLVGNLYLFVVIGRALLWSSSFSCWLHRTSWYYWIFVVSLYSNFLICIMQTTFLLMEITSKVSDKIVWMNSSNFSVWTGSSLTCLQVGIHLDLPYKWWPLTYLNLHGPFLLLKMSYMVFLAVHVLAIFELLNSKFC